MARIGIKEITAMVEEIFAREGVERATAKAITEVLIDTEMKGIFTHGLLRVPKYVACLRSGGVKPQGEIDIISDSPSLALVSGRGGLGIAIARNAMELAISKAKATGVGAVSVRGSHHLGATGYYANMCAERGMIGISMSNGNPLVAATGSCEKSIGNNPFAYAVPAGKHGTVLYDIAMSCGSDMKIIAMYKNGEKVPEGWMIDKDGNPSTNPGDYLEGGTLLPFGGYKGYGLAMMVELLAASLSGANCLGDAKAWNVVPGKDGGSIGHLFMAIDVSKITDTADFIRRNERIIDGIAASKLAVGADKIYYPGEKEKISKEACLKIGTIDVNDETLAAINNLYNE